MKTTHYGDFSGVNALKNARFNYLIFTYCCLCACQGW